MIIYLDESGDLGFDFASKRPSRKFVVALLVCDSGRGNACFQGGSAAHLEEQTESCKQAPTGGRRAQGNRHDA